LPVSLPASIGPPYKVRTTRIIVSIATDAPFLPDDLVMRLTDGLMEAGADLACAASGGACAPGVGLWPVRLREDLRRAMVDDEIRKVDPVDRAPSLDDGAFRRHASRPVFQRKPARGF
jgi:molybdopterin-guanine dinucleotide biosynthesis protein A